MIDVWVQNWSDHFYRKFLAHYMKLQLFYALLFCLANWPYILLAIPMSIMSDGPTPPSRFPR